MKTFDQLIITTGFLASASPAMADEEPEEENGRTKKLVIISDDHTSQAWGLYGDLASFVYFWINSQRIRE